MMQCGKLSRPYMVTRLIPGVRANGVTLSRRPPFGVHFTRSLGPIAGEDRPTEKPPTRALKLI